MFFTGVEVRSKRWLGHDGPGVRPFLENDKIVEHWDVIQEVPEHTANPNGMF